MRTIAAALAVAGILGAAAAFAEPPAAPQPVAPQPAAPQTAPAQPAAKPPAAQQPAAPAPDRKGLVNNVWMDTPLVQVLRDISTQVGVTITVDPQLADLPVSLEVHDLSLADCLARITVGKGLAVRQVDPGLYVIGSDRPGAPSFTVIAEARRLPLQYITAHHFRESMPSDLRPYVSSGDRTTEVQLFAPPEKMARILEMAQQMDAPVPQVVLEALVVELSRTGGEQIGIGWEVDGPNSSFSLQDGADAFLGAARYTTVSERKFTALTTALHLLVSAGKAKVRSRPRVATLNGTTATIDASLEEFFTIITDLNGSYLRTELQSVKSGVLLKMAPQVGADGDITVHIETEVSDVVSRRVDVVGNNGVQDSLPVIRRRKAETFIRVKSGEAVVIGGLVESQNRETVNRVPILGSIPLLGALFTSKSHTTVENEVVIFIKPRLLTPGESAAQGGHETLNVEKERQRLQNPPAAHPPVENALDKPTTGETW